MFLTDLADVIRAAGFTVVEAPGWKTRGYKGRGMRSVSSIIVHHTATSSRASGNYPTYSTILKGTATPGPLSQLGLGRDGKTVYVFAAGVANHAGTTWHTWQSNSNAIGIEVEHVGTTTTWSDEQYAGIVRLARALSDHYGVPVPRVLGHKEIAKPAGRKSDPTFSMSTFRDDVRRGSHAVIPTNPGGFLMALSDAEQAEVLRLVRALPNASVVDERVNGALDSVRRTQADHTGKLDRVIAQTRHTDDRVAVGFREQAVARLTDAKVRTVVTEVVGTVPTATADELARRLRALLAADDTKETA